MCYLIPDMPTGRKWEFQLFALGSVSFGNLSNCVVNVSGKTSYQLIAYVGLSPTQLINVLTVKNDGPQSDIYVTITGISNQAF